MTVYVFNLNFESEEAAIIIIAETQYSDNRNSTTLFKLNTGIAITDHFFVNLSERFMRDYT